MNVIRELLYIKHNFADMTLYSKDEVDFILEYCCTSEILFFIFLFLCLCTLYINNYLAQLARRTTVSRVTQDAAPDHLTL